MESEVDSLYIGMIGKYKKKAVHQAKCTVWHETATVRGVAINFNLDTGADAFVLPMHMFRKLPGPFSYGPQRLS